MEKIITEIFTACKEKISSPLIRYFSISWILWNYKIVYFILFQNQEIFFNTHKITKYDYLINNTFYDIWYICILFIFLLPLVSAIFFIYIFPLINNKILEFHILNIDKEDNIKQKHRKSVRKRDLEISKIILKEKETEVKIVKEEVKKSKTEKENKNLEDEKLIKEFNKFKKSSLYNNFDNIIEIIDFHNGNFLGYNSRVSNEDISYLIANKLIEKNGKNTNFHIFTNKGIHFTKLYFDDINKYY